MDIEYKKIYDIKTLQNYKELLKNMDLNEYDDTSVDNINIYELEDIIHNNTNNYYKNTSIYHIFPIFSYFMFTIGSISVITIYNNYSIYNNLM